MPRRRVTRLLLCCALAAGLPRAVVASPLEPIPPDDPILPELRVLELLDAPGAGARITLPHFSSLPLQRLELMGAADSAAVRRRDIARWRIERALARDATVAFADPAAPRSTPRLFQRLDPGEQRFELSTSLEGGYDGARTSSGAGAGRWRDGSGLHLRAGAQFDGWLAFTHLTFGELRGARGFTDVLVSNTDVAVETQESSISYTHGRAWSVGVGRGHWQWGPGEEATLLLSRTSAPLTALWLHGRLEALRADAFALHATLDPGRGEQLAAHRLEWQPRDGLRLGVSEAARYHAAGFQGVYLVSVIPFSLAQRLLQQDTDSSSAVRNNVAVAADVAWRIADGTRVYAELLADDLHAKTASIPNKYGWQAGVDGSGDVHGLRVTWNAEATWLSRFVYTSFFGRTFEAHGEPLGFPTGPDARRVRVRVGCDPSPDWQLTAIAALTRKGENGLDEPFIPGSPVPDVGTLEGTAERTRELSGTLRWWPASGIDVAGTLGWRRRDDAGHVAGAVATETFGSLVFRIGR